jgi:hypothetical protein
MKTLKTTILIALSFLTVFAANGQNADSSKMHMWFMHHHQQNAFQLQVTYRSADLGQINQALANNGIPALTGNNIWFNLSSSHVYDNGFLTEDGIGFTPLSYASSNNYQTQFNQYQLYFRIGYNFSKNQNFRVYPFAGINLSDAVLNIQDDNRINSVSNFTQEIANNTASKTFNQQNFGVELGAGFDYVIRFSSKQVDCVTIERFLPIGIRAGYYIQATNGDWKINNYSLSNAPENKQSAFFATLTIGLGFGIKK